MRSEPQALPHLEQTEARIYQLKTKAEYHLELCEAYLRAAERKKKAIRLRMIGMRG